MPSAEELARGRAREAECERELQQLRAETDPALAAPDSSGSEVSQKSQFKQKSVSFSTNDHRNKTYRVKQR